MQTDSATRSPARGPGTTVRSWRERRRLSQQALSDRTGVSTRHLSYIETGRANPSREMLSRLGEALDLPVREQRRLFTEAGFAPVASELDLDAPQLRHVVTAMESILSGHDPFPAFIIDGGWNLISANESAYRLLSDVPATLLEPPINLVRLSLDPKGLAPRIENLDSWTAAIVHRIRHEFERTADARLAALLDQVPKLPPSTGAPEVVLTLRLRVAERSLSFITTTTVFGTPSDATIADLAIEALYPADDATRDFLLAAE